MILLGIRDLTGKEIFELVQGNTEILIDKKIQDEFGKANEAFKPCVPNSDVTAKNLNWLQDQTIPAFLHRQLSRSILLALTVYVMQNRTAFRCNLLTFLVSKLNSNAILPPGELKNALVTIFDGQLLEPELLIINNALQQILDTANLILEFFWLKLATEFQRLEACLFMEAHKINFNFLVELEKANYDDRRLARVLNLYRNYFKKRTADKQDPPASFYKEVFLAYQIDLQLQVLEKLTTTALSFERKAYLQNKQVVECDFLIGYSANTEIALDDLKTAVQKIQKIKEIRSPISGLGEKLLQNTLSIPDTNKQELIYSVLMSFLNDFVRISQTIAHQSSENQKALKNNPKFKAKSSESWQQLETLLNFSSMKTNQETINDESFAIKDILATLNAISFTSLNRLLVEVFTPVLEQNKKPKIPKGTRDYNPLQMTIKSRAIDKIRCIYQKHGAEEIDTPIFELKETLLGKYGEEGGKLIYDLEDQGGELLSLRYDLTVPFARYMGLNNLTRMKRFHIGKVYRRDQPNINKGRFREFYQCDLDIAGKTDLMLAEAEVLKIIVEILSEFGLKFKIKICHRLLLEAMIECAKCESKKFKMICSSIDKLDKEPWEAVENELIFEKGLTPEQAAVLKSFVLHRGKVADVLQLVTSQKLFGDNQKAKTSLAEMAKLEGYLRSFGAYDLIEFDLSLARGLDYYTGMIFEAVLTDGEFGLGSIAGGGRYDELIGMFSKDQIPAVGGSIGIERLFVILEEKQKGSSRSSITEFLVASIGKSGTLERKLQIVNDLWNVGLSAEIIHDEYPRPDKQLKYALEKHIPYVIWVGEDEVKNNVVKIKNLYLKKEVVVPGDQLLQNAKDLSVSYRKDLAHGTVVFED